MNVNENPPTVMTFREAVELIGRNRVQTMIRSGRWQQPCRGIYVTHNGVITADERDLIALKVCGRGAALAGLTALKHDGFKGFDAAMPTVVQPAGSSAPPPTKTSTPTGRSG